MYYQAKRRITARNSSPYKKTIIGIIAIVLLLSTISISYTYYTTNSKKIIDYAEWIVRPGECVWTISSYFTPAGWDKRIVVDEILRANDIKGHIQPGQVLQIPIYE